MNSGFDNFFARLVASPRMFWLQYKALRPHLSRYSSFVLSLRFTLDLVRP